MPDEYDTSEEIFSSFIPLLILLIGLIGWAGYQDYAVNAQRDFFAQQLTQAGPVFEAAQNWQGKYTALMKDLNQISAKDPAAAAIMKAAVQAGIQQGLIRVNQAQPSPDAAGGTNAMASPAPPDSPK